MFNTLFLPLSLANFEIITQYFVMSSKTSRIASLILTKISAGGLSTNWPKVMYVRLFICLLSGRRLNCWTDSNPTWGSFTKR
jgi:hypothetical protein